MGPRTVELCRLLAQAEAEADPTALEPACRLSMRLPPPTAALYIDGVRPSLPTAARTAVSLSPSRSAVTKTFAPGRIAD